MKMTLLSSEPAETIQQLRDDLRMAIVTRDVRLWHEDELTHAPADRAVVIDAFVSFFLAQVTRPFASSVEMMADSYSTQTEIVYYWLPHARELGWTEMTDEWTDLSIDARQQILQDVPQLFAWLDRWCGEHAHTQTIAAPHIDPHLKPSRR